MFHQGEPRFRAWLTAFAGAQPRSARRLHDEIRRLSEQLAESESDRAARLKLIHRLQAEAAERAETVSRMAAQSDELAADADRLATALAEREAEGAVRLASLERLESDRVELLEHVARLEAALEETHRERERWLAVLPVLRVRLPGGGTTARRLRALRRRLAGRGSASGGDSV